MKPDCPDLPNNKAGSLARLGNLIRKLKRNPELFDECEKIIEEQKEEGIIETAPDEQRGREFYLPFKPIVRESANSIKPSLSTTHQHEPLITPHL